MRRTIILILGMSALGCVAEGGFADKNSQKGVEELVEQSAVQEDSADDAKPDGLIIVGTVSAYRPLTGKNFDEIYAGYRDFSELIHPDLPPSLSADQFKEKIAGWTKLKVLTVPLIGYYKYALVPVSLSKEIDFPSAAGTSLFQEAGDLLAARTNEDGFYIISEVLCKNGRGYSECAASYDKGLFDALTGQELDDQSLKPKRSGKAIDPITYKRTERTEKVEELSTENSTVESRLRQLDRLYEEKLITEQEYNEKRQEILSEL